MHWRVMQKDSCKSYFSVHSFWPSCLKIWNKPSFQALTAYACCAGNGKTSYQLLITWRRPRTLPLFWLQGSVWGAEVLQTKSSRDVQFCFFSSTYSWRNDTQAPLHCKKLHWKNYLQKSRILLKKINIYICIYIYISGKVLSYLK